jgi:hypothetical protein
LLNSQIISFSNFQIHLSFPPSADGRTDKDQVVYGISIPPSAEKTKRFKESLNSQIISFSNFQIHLSFPPSADGRTKTKWFKELLNSQIISFSNFQIHLSFPPSADGRKTLRIFFENPCVLSHQHINSSAHQLISTSLHHQPFSFGKVKQGKPA